MHRIAESYLCAVVAFNVLFNVLAIYLCTFAKKKAIYLCTWYLSILHKIRGHHEILHNSRVNGQTLLHPYDYLEHFSVSELFS